MFIVVNNVIGIIPGMKPGTGTISTTAALALIAFVYFVWVGVKNHGAFGYLKSLAPKGVAFPLNVLIWIIEVISTLLRPIAQFTAANLMGALPSVAFAAILFVIYAIEIFVGVIQAYVFTVLTAVYIQGAEAKGH